VKMRTAEHDLFSAPTPPSPWVMRATPEPINPDRWFVPCEESETIFAALLRRREGWPVQYRSQLPIMLRHPAARIEEADREGRVANLTGIRLTEGSP
jgi:hypothetical protein